MMKRLSFASFASCMWRLALFSIVACVAACSHSPPSRSSSAPVPAPPTLAPVSARPIVVADPTTWACACGTEAQCVDKCEQKSSAEDCGTLAACYAGASAFARDPKKFARYSERGCDLGAVMACNNLAQAYRFGAGVEKSIERSDRLFARVANIYLQRCNGNSGADCRELADLYARGWGLKQSIETASELWERACNLGDTITCLLLGKAAEERGDSEEALDWFLRSCQQSCPSACTPLHERMLTSEQSAALERRCARGEVVACCVRGQNERLDCKHPQWAGVTRAVDVYCAHAVEEAQRTNCRSLKTSFEQCPILHLGSDGSTWELSTPDLSARFQRERDGTWKLVEVGRGP